MPSKGESSQVDKSAEPLRLGKAPDSGFVFRAEVPDSAENVDMSLEELQQLLLRNHHQGAVESGTVMDVS